jgi:hypothetical protein
MHTDRSGKTRRQKLCAKGSGKKLTFSVRHLNAIKSTAGRSFLGIKPLPALQQM